MYLVVLGGRFIVFNELLDVRVVAGFIILVVVNMNVVNYRNIIRRVD